MNQYGSLRVWICNSGEFVAGHDTCISLLPYLFPGLTPFPVGRPSVVIEFSVNRNTGRNFKVVVNEFLFGVFIDRPLPHWHNSCAAHFCGTSTMAFMWHGTRLTWAALFTLRYPYEGQRDGR
ncbi:hypothetical protein E2C01_021983 [Portunus trituberculatus]|uniref:Uncharacterized protein n=1 Tax=Portunus trituberculatus TaxID=210409 RepID=A0A5B7E411_PORTR|nr:hypothetical protein [Portunus trituberculatus]